MYSSISTEPERPLSFSTASVRSQQDKPRSSAYGLVKWQRNPTKFGLKLVTDNSLYSNQEGRTSQEFQCRKKMIQPLKCPISAKLLTCQTKAREVQELVSNYSFKFLSHSPPAYLAPWSLGSHFLWVQQKHRQGESLKAQQGILTSLPM